MKSKIWVTAVALAALCFFDGNVQARRLILTTLGNQFAFDDWKINIDILNINAPEKGSDDVTDCVFVVYFDVQNNGLHADTFNPHEDLRVIAGGHVFSDINAMKDDYYPSLREIQPGMTQIRQGAYLIPRSFFKDILIIRAKNHDIKVKVSPLGSYLPYGSSYVGPEETR
jgi:hypothetical protein